MARLGAVQLHDIQGDITVSIATIRRWVAHAEDEGLDILCFPECYLQGYTLDIAETKERALHLKSEQFQEVLRTLAGYNVTIILGLIEQNGDSYYNTAVVIQDGKLLGKYRKVHLFEKNFQPGTQYPVFSYSEMKFGINICYDARFADGAEALARKGANVIFYPLNNRLPAEKASAYRDKHVPNLVERARETGCWVVSADVIAQDGTHTGYGHTTIVDPYGKVYVQVPQLHEGMILAET